MQLLLLKVCESFRFGQIKKLEVYFGLYEPSSAFTEAVVQRCSVKKVFLEISQNSQDNICVVVSFLIKLQPRCFPVNFAKLLRINVYVK